MASYLGTEAHPVHDVAHGGTVEELQQVVYVEVSFRRSDRQET